MSKKTPKKKKSGKLSNTEREELEQLRAEKKKAAKKSSKRLEFKRAKNNYMSIYFGGKFPANIPLDACLRLLTKSRKRCIAFIEAELAKEED